MNQLWENKRKEIGDAAKRALSRVKPRRESKVIFNEFKFQLDLRNKISS